LCHTISHFWNEFRCPSNNYSLIIIRKNEILLPKSLTFVSKAKYETPERILFQIPISAALNGIGRLYFVRSFQASNRISMILLINANTGANLFVFITFKWKDTESNDLRKGSDKQCNKTELNDYKLNEKSC
jgi:hypothetical protein